MLYHFQTNTKVFPSTAFPNPSLFSIYSILSYRHILLSYPNSANFDGFIFTRPLTHLPLPKDRLLVHFIPPLLIFIPLSNFHSPFVYNPAFLLSFLPMMLYCITLISFPDCIVLYCIYCSIHSILSYRSYLCSLVV
jgi:hypothetical protein